MKKILILESFLNLFFIRSPEMKNENRKKDSDSQNLFFQDRWLGTEGGSKGENGRNPKRIVYYACGAGGWGEAVEAFLKEAQLIRNYPVYKFSRDDKALDLVQRDH